MVFNIKGTSSLRDITSLDIDLICKTMINIEKNKNIYNLRGSENPLPISNTPFNSYTHKQVEYNISASMGVLVIYTKESFTFNQLSNLMISKFLELGKDFDVDLPYTNNSSKSTYHTLVTIPTSQLVSNTTSVNIDKSYRKLTAFAYDIKRFCEAGSRFVWYVNIIDTNPYLHIPEMSEYIPHNEYLMRSVSTIIYDGIDLFSIHTGNKQLDYPSLSQYKLFNDNRVVASNILISEVFGLDYEILTHYIKSYVDTTMKVTVSYRNIVETKFCELVDYNTFEICRVDKNKTWHSQINNIFNYKVQEELEMNCNEIGKPSFPNNVCFITHIPLYQYVYILKIAKLRNPDDLFQHATDIKHIMISPLVYHSYINGFMFIDYFKLMCKYIIMEVSISDYPKTELDIITEIPDDKIHPIKKDILQCISKNGCSMVSLPNFQKKLYTINLEKKIIYLGYINFVDSILCNNNLTNTILFNYKLF